MLNLYFRFIRFSLGLCDGREFLQGDALVGFDWQRFFAFAQKQTLVGIAMDGIQRLPKEKAPDTALLMKWFAASRAIARQNVVLNEATVMVYRTITDAGYRCCILKGQGNALMYPNSSARMPGDVDVWVNASREDIRRLAAIMANDGGMVVEESYNHVELMMNGIAVELHHTPAVMCNAVYNSRLQRWLKLNVKRACNNIVALPDEVGGVAVPPAEFNAVYQLYHLYHHYFYEGIGLRQVIDYFFVLLNVRGLADGVHGVSENDAHKVKPRSLSGESGATEYLIDDVVHRLRLLGLMQFAGAMMYVLHEVLGLRDDCMIVPMDAKRGKMLLDDILHGGNFGHYGNSRRFGDGAIGHNVQRLWRDACLLRYYPAEALSEPLFRLWHWLWRRFVALHP